MEELIDKLSKTCENCKYRGMLSINYPCCDCLVRESDNGCVTFTKFSPIDATCIPKSMQKTERGKRMTGCDKESIKDAIRKIGSYLVDNADAIAGDFDLMTGFDLNIKFRTDKEYLEFPEISFTNHHYIPISILDEE